jgi:hypothetical protein
MQEVRVLKNVKRVDNSASFNHTEYPVRDGIYNSIVRRYGVNGHQWNKSDEIIWGGAIYQVADLGFTLLFLWVVYLVANSLYNHYGIFRAVAFLVVMGLLRINTLIRKVDFTNRILKGK